MLDQATNAILNDQRLPEHSKFSISGILCKVTCKILDLIWLGQITVCSYHLLSICFWARPMNTLYHLFLNV